MVRRDEEDFIGESSLGERDKRLEENKQFHRKECTWTKPNGASNERRGHMRGGAYRPTRLRVPCALTAHVTSDSSTAVSAG